jgi:hypothetical protein
MEWDEFQTKYAKLLLRTKDTWGIRFSSLRRRDEKKLPLGDGHVGRRRREKKNT